MFLLTLSTPVRKRFDLFITLLKTKIHRYTYILFSTLLVTVHLYR